MSEQTLIEKAQTAIGGDDTILAAAWFEPRGTNGGLVAGGAMGAGLGHVLGGGIGGAVGDLAGAAIGYESAKHTEDFGVGSHDGATVHQVSFRSLVAVSETRLYGWRVGHKGIHQVPTDELFAIDRGDLGVAVHSRVGVHTFEVHDRRANETWEFEAGRIESHLKYVLDHLHDADETASA